MPATLTTPAVTSITRVFSHADGEPRVTLTYTFDPRLNRPHVVVMKGEGETPEVYRSATVGGARAAWSGLQRGLLEGGFSY